MIRIRNGRERDLVEHGQGERRDESLKSLVSSDY